MLRSPKHEARKRRGYFHLAAYSAQPGSGTTTDMTALTDSVISQRNGHYIFTNPFYLLGVSMYGSAALRGNILSPTLNSITKFNIWPMNSSTISASPPRMDIWTQYPVPLPQNEEIQVQVTTSGADTTTCMLVLGLQSPITPIPQGKPPLPVFEMRFTASPTFNTQTWAGLGAPTFEQSLRGGTYAVVGAQFQATGLLAARAVFPVPPLVQSRPVRPGALASQAIGDQPLQVYPYGPMLWGEWGRFSTAELPQFEYLGMGSASQAVEGRMWLVWLSDSVTVNYGTSGPY